MFNKFRQLGNMIDNKGCTTMTVHDRIQIGNRKYYASSRLLRSKIIRYHTKTKIC